MYKITVKSVYNGHSKNTIHWFRREVGVLKPAKALQ